jgi:hypothetical protein
MTREDVNRGMEALWRYVRSLGRLDKPGRGWVGLTEYEVNREASMSPDYYTFRSGVEWAEQRLKEKNGGVP